MPARGRAGRGGGVLALAVAILTSGCAGPVHQPDPPPEGELITSVWVVSHGWHTGVVIRRRDVPDDRWPQLRDFAGSELVEVGWGERDFYMAPVGTSGLALRAAIVPSSSVLHVAGFSVPPERHFAASEVVVEIAVSRRGLEQLAAFVGDAYATDEAGAAIHLGPGHYPQSRFYLARETYHALKTCNTWTAKALRAAGCPVTPFHALTAGNVIDQVTAVCGATRVSR